MALFCISIPKTICRCSRPTWNRGKIGRTEQSLQIARSRTSRHAGPSSEGKAQGLSLDVAIKARRHAVDGGTAWPQTASPYSLGTALDKAWRRAF